MSSTSTRRGSRSEAHGVRQGVVLETAHIQTPIEEIYFTGNMLSKYEAATESLKDIIQTDGDNEETWEKFDVHFTKPYGLLRARNVLKLRFLNMSWATNWDGMRYDIVFYGRSLHIDAMPTCGCVRRLGIHGLPHDPVPQEQLGSSFLKASESAPGTALKRNPEQFTFAFAGRTASKVQELRDREFQGTEWEDTPILQALPSGVADRIRYIYHISQYVYSV